ncbi:hypothetical protein DXG01_014565 [Tephrocybe rancida]|nr:hypothetical protein DXG01_014565 [Tephrocybe rancida]
MGFWISLSRPFRFHLLPAKRLDINTVHFLSQIFPEQSTDSFHSAVRKNLLEDLQGLDPAALLEVKRLIRAGLRDKNDPDAVNLRESYGNVPVFFVHEQTLSSVIYIAQAARFATGIPAKRFAKIARKEIKHKL